MPSESGAVRWYSWERKLLLPAFAIAAVSLFVMFLGVFFSTVLDFFTLAPGFPLLVIAAAAEGVLVTRIARSRSWRATKRFREILLLLAAARIAVALGNGGLRGLATLTRLEELGSPNFLLHALALLLAWLWAIGWIGDIDRLLFALPETELTAGSEEFQKWLSNARAWVQKGRTDALRLRFLLFALALIICFGTFAQILVRAPWLGQTYTALRWMGIGFSVIGLLLQSYVSLLRKRLDWLGDRPQQAIDISRGWLLSSAGVVVAIAAIAFLLPTNYSPITGKSSAVFGFLAGLFPAPEPGKEMSRVGEAFTSMAEAIRQSAQVEAANAPVRATVISVLFDFLARNARLIRRAFILVVLLALLLYLAWPLVRRKTLPTTNQAWRWLARLAKATMAVLRALTIALRLMFHALMTLLRGDGRRKTGSARESDLGAILGLAVGSRQRKAGFSRQALHVLDLYRKLIEEAGGRGYPYRSSQTANEYSAWLGESLPIIEGWLHTLTLLFLRVRYGRVTPSHEERSAADDSWEKIRLYFQKGV